MTIREVEETLEYFKEEVPAEYYVLDRISEGNATVNNYLHVESMAKVLSTLYKGTIEHVKVLESLGTLSVYANFASGEHVELLGFKSVEALIEHLGSRNLMNEWEVS